MAFDFASMNPFASKAPAAPTQPVAPTVPAKPDGATLPNDAGKADATADPLAPFAKMYDTSKTPDAPPQFALDGAALETAAKSLNFMQGVDPALMQKAQSGDSAALLQLIEHTGRMAYQSALSHSSTLTGKFTEAREAFNNKDFSGRVKSELTVNAMTGMANFNHPVVRKELIKVAKDMQSQHPDASPQEVAEMAKTYITELSRAVNPTSSQNSSKNEPQATDWDNFFDQN
jgi:hypothetical protein